MHKVKGVNMLIQRRGFLKGLGLATCAGLSLEPCFASMVSLPKGQSKDVKFFSDKRILALSERYDIILDSFGSTAELIDILGQKASLKRPNINPLAPATMPHYVSATHVFDDSIVLLDKSHRQLDFFQHGNFQKSIDLSSYTQNPSQIYQDGESLWIIDSATHSAISMDINGRIISQFGQLGTESGRLNAPIDIAVDQDGLTHILEMGNQRISVWSKQGKWQGSYGEKSLTAGSRKLVLNDHANQTLVIDSWKQTLLSLDPMGKHDIALPFDGLTPERFTSLTYLSTAPGKSLYLSA